MRWRSTGQKAMVGLVWGLTLTLSACGSRPATVVNPNPSVSNAAITPLASPSPGPGLFVVLEARGGSATSAEGQQHNRVAIVGMDGYARAKTTFQPRQSPVVGNAATLLAPEAVVAAGGVYFIDGLGVVRRLGVKGELSTITTFPLTERQQEISFAVSPDGNTLLAARLTLPNLTWPPPPRPTSTPSGRYVLEVFIAGPGRSPRPLRRWESQVSPDLHTASTFQMIRFVGWDNAGAVALVRGQLGTQNAVLDGQTLFAGHFANIDIRTGEPGDAVGGCQAQLVWPQPWSISGNGNVVCATQDRVIVRSAPGLELFSVAYPLPINRPGGSFTLSPAGDRLAMDLQVADRSGRTTPLREDLRPVGWLNEQILFTGVPSSDFAQCRGEYDLSFVDLTNPAVAQDLGFCADFVGSL